VKNDAVVKQATIEDVVNYWNARPCNIRHSKKPVGTKEYFDEVEQRKYFVEPHIPGFAEFPRWNGKKVLEVGCGMGTEAVNFARAGAIYTGVDVSSESLSLTKKRFECYNLSGSFIECNGEELSKCIPEEKFDFIFSFGVIHHTPNPRAVIEEIRKLIKPDGIFRLMLYAKNSWKNIMIEGGLDQPEAQAGCPIAVTYTKEMVEELLKGQFVVSELRQTHIFPYIIEKYVKYEYELQPWFKSMPLQMRKILESFLGWHLLISAKPI
jgi:2-polyprenyl-3-methyl-5-hydroxy-6-metoxy-1,4-benzoquinol methylase